MTMGIFFRRRQLTWLLTAVVALAWVCLAWGTCTSVAQESTIPTAEGMPFEEQPYDFDEPPRQETMLFWFVRSLGLRYLAWFFFLFVVSGVWFLWCLPTAIRGFICPGEIVHRVPHMLEQGQTDQVQAHVSRSNTYLGRILTVGLQNLSAGAPRASAVMLRAAEFEETKYRNRLSYLALLVAAFLIVGVFGAVDGTMISFIVIAHAPTSPKPSEIAEGISTALVSLYVGLVPALPLLLAYCILRNRSRRLAAEARLQAELLLTRVQSTGKYAAVQDAIIVAK